MKNLSRRADLGCPGDVSISWIKFVARRRVSRRVESQRLLFLSERQTEDGSREGTGWDE